MQDSGPYILVSKLGEGGMAEVFKAMKKGPEGFEKPIALKRILPHLADNEAFINMLSAEARLHAQLDHPNLVQVLDFFKEDTTFVIAMEYVAGKNLRQLIRDAHNQKTVLPWEGAVHIMSEALKGLEFAHKRKGSAGPLEIVHRDVSPQNILISYEGIIKLTDFGIAWANIAREQTESGVLKGKQRYLAPEQLESKKVDPRTDIFSSAVVLYELLCDCHPFEAANDFESMKKIVKAQFEPSENLRPDLPASVHIALSKALSAKPANRFDDAASFRQALLIGQKPLWLQRGSEELALWMNSLYPNAEDREESILEKTPLLSRSSIPSAPQIEPVVSTISGVAEVSMLRGARRLHFKRKHVGWAFAASMVIVASYTVWNWSRPPEVQSAANERAILRTPFPTATPVRTPEPTPVVVVTPAVTPTTAAKRVAMIKSPTERKPPAINKMILGNLRMLGPVGALVFINGKQIGVLPLPDQSLSPGSYLVSIAPSGKMGATLKVEVKPKKTSTVRWRD